MILFHTHVKLLNQIKLNYSEIEVILSFKERLLALIFEKHLYSNRLKHYILQLQTKRWALTDLDTNRKVPVCSSGLTSEWLSISQ